MSRPPMVNYKTEAEYLEHYKREYCRKEIYTVDKIRVFFDPDRFNHAFFDGKIKAVKFSLLRARYIDWIKYTLESPTSKLYQGYNSDTKSNMPHRRVAVVNNDKYAVVIEMFFRKGVLCAKFKTAFYADKSHAAIAKNPEWVRVDCENYLKNVDKKDVGS